jgi:type VI secretion system ImpM family protein
MIFSFLKNKKCVSLDFVSAFGKLPIYAEFIKYHMNDLRLHAFDEWCQGAHEFFNKQNGLRFDNSFSDIPNYYFLLNAANSSFCPIIGLMHRSQDLSGRSYPFVTCRFLNNPIAKEHLAAVPFLYQDYFQAARDVFLRASCYQDLDSFVCDLNKLAEKNRNFHKLNVLEEVLEKLKSSTLNDFFQDVLFYNWCERLRGLKELFDKGKVRAVRFLLPKKIRDISLVFILQVLEELIGLHQRAWQVFWGIESNACSQVLIVFEKLQVEDWFMLLDASAMIDSDVFDFLSWQTTEQVAGKDSLSASISLIEAVNIVSAGKMKNNSD